ncbi:hypothetical protein NEBULOUS_57 [Microbacterium phage Nebulous]|nr:hypothetical protein NEBULOUS_57 [Microbacterium phage Nebulous]
MTTEQMDDKDAMLAGFPDAAAQREERLRAAGKTNREDAERELNALRGQLSQTEPVTEDVIRVRSSVRIVNKNWVEVSLQIRLADGMPWLDCLNSDHPVLMSRRAALFSEDQTEYITRVIRRFIGMDAGLSWRLDPRWETRVGQGVTEYRTWMVFSSRSGVAVRTRPDGMLNVYGL